MNVRAFALLMLVGFVAVGVFGFAGMSHDMSHGSGCIASTLNNSVVCPQDALSSALYHIAAYQSFSQATIISLSFSALALLILLAALFAVRKKILLIPSAPLCILSKRRDDIPLPRREKFLRRLSLFENSPSRFCSA
ncbi:TPA: hypothetical protein DIS55_00980 [Candidatus Kaiserbacteria bacterium]|uniref:Uncharacterized protein n=4 Tax=Candidatus Kaiseribacteriota TaxID=1752734 RepID=A0A1F6FNJ3_9BACT|nr:MAG: hypothetical protein A3H15_02890 [Candidatus Kaiserbacteria bacterium RIFCSPLOWO2_12_FULL_50_28]HCM43509.1 hypothetical protein [Candidatus Kaiserbacteria bacterium]